MRTTGTCRNGLQIRQSVLDAELLDMLTAALAPDVIAEAIARASRHAGATGGWAPAGITAAAEIVSRLPSGAAEQSTGAHQRPTGNSVTAARAASAVV